MRGHVLIVGGVVVKVMPTPTTKTCWEFITVYNKELNKTTHQQMLSQWFGV